MVGMNQKVNLQTRGGLRLSLDILYDKGKLRYNLMGKPRQSSLRSRMCP